MLRIGLAIAAIATVVYVVKVRVKTKTDHVNAIFENLDDNVTEKAKQKLQYKHASHLDRQIAKLRGRLGPTHKPIGVIGAPPAPTRRQRFDRIGHRMRTYKPGFIISS